MTERQQQDDLAGAFLQQLESQKSQETSLGSLLCKRRLLGLEKRIKALEKEVEKLSKQQNYSDEIMMDKCLHNQISDGISEITLCFHLAALIPPVYCSIGTIIQFNEIVSDVACSRETLLGAWVFGKFDNYWGPIIKQYFRTGSWRYLHGWMDVKSIKSSQRKIASRLQIQMLTVTLYNLTPIPSPASFRS